MRAGGSPELPQAPAPAVAAQAALQGPLPGLSLLPAGHECSVAVLRRIHRGQQAICAAILAALLTAALPRCARSSRPVAPWAQRAERMAGATWDNGGCVSVGAGSSYGC